MIISQIVGALASKEILSILGLGSATVVAALTQKFFKSRAFARLCFDIRSGIDTAISTIPVVK